jgi:hypothetical protein
VAFILDSIARAGFSLASKSLSNLMIYARLVCRLIEENDGAPVGTGVSDRQRASSNEPKSKNYQDGKDKENDGRNPIASGHSICAHGTIPLRTFVTLLAAIAHTVSHTGVTFR